MRLEDLIIIALGNGQGHPSGVIAYMLREQRAHVLPILNNLVHQKILRCETYLNNYYYLLNDRKILNRFSQAQLKEAYHCLRPALPARTDEHTRYARICLGHLAGKVGVILREGLFHAGMLRKSDYQYGITQKGKEAFKQLGLAQHLLNTQNTVDVCLDWTERYHHLGGQFGKQLTNCLFEKQWIIKRKTGRSVIITPKGHLAFKKHFKISLD